MSTDTPGVVTPEPALTAVHQAFAREWLAATLRAHPSQAGGFLRESASPFRNPVGATLRAALSGLTAELFGDFDRQRAAVLIDPVVRLRAVQDVPPAEVTAFVALARQAAARVARAAPSDVGPELLDRLGRRISDLSQVAEGCLARCREDLQAIADRAACRRNFVAGRIRARTAARADGSLAAKPPVSRGGMS